jgi:hypothetical protein
MSTGKTKRKAGRRVRRTALRKRNVDGARPMAESDRQGERAGLAYDVVNRASNDSFPASDAPAWINCGDPAA